MVRNTHHQLTFSLQVNFLSSLFSFCNSNYCDYKQLIQTALAALFAYSSPLVIFCIWFCLLIILYIAKRSATVNTKCGSHQKQPQKHNFSAVFFGGHKKMRIEVSEKKQFCNSQRASLFIFHLFSPLVQFCLNLHQFLNR